MIPEQEEQYKSVAFLRKPHGIEGEMVAELGLDAPDLFEHETLFWVELPGQKLIPLRVASYRQKGGAGALTFFVKFAGINSRDDVARYQSLHLKLPAQAVAAWEPEQPDEPSTLVGYLAEDPDAGISSEVVEMIDNPAHAILMLENGMMIPAVDEYITGIDDEQRLIECQHLNLLAEPE